MPQCKAVEFEAFFPIAFNVQKSDSCTETRLRSATVSIYTTIQGI